jgi:hypothetical protein
MLPNVIQAQECDASKAALLSKAGTMKMINILAVKIDNLPAFANHYW